MFFFIYQFNSEEQEDILKNVISLLLFLLNIAAISESISCRTEAAQRRAGGLDEEGISHELWLNTT